MILLLISTFLVLLSRLYYIKKFRYFITLPFNPASKDFEDDFNPHGIQDLFDVLLSINSYLIFSIGCFLIVNPLAGSFIDFFRILLVLTVFFLLKTLIQLLVGWLFEKQEHIVKAHNTNLAYRSWVAIMLLPLLFVLIYLPVLKNLVPEILTLVLVLTYFIIVVLSTFRLWKMHAKIYYKILYICALEITPFFFLVSWLEGQIN